MIVASTGHAWPNTTYQQARELTVTETNNKAWTNVAVSWRGLNLSGATTSMTELVLYNESCSAGSSAGQLPLSINGSLDGYNSPTLYNISYLVNLTALQARTFCIMWGNTTTVSPPRIVLAWDTFNESAITTAKWSNETFTGSTFTVSGGEAILSLVTDNTWFANQTGNARLFSKISFTRGFSVSCETKWTIEGTGSEMGCGAYKEPDQAGFSMTLTGVVNFVDSSSDTGMRTTTAQALFTGDFSDASSSAYLNTTVKISSTTTTGYYNASLGNGSSVVAALSNSQSRNKAGILAFSRDTGDTPSLNVKWICAVDQNYTCVANDDAAFTQSQGSIQSATGIHSLTIATPANYTLLNHMQLVNFSFVSNSNATANCSYIVDGTTTVQLADVANNTANVTIYTFNSDGGHTVSVTCNDNYSNATATVSFTLFAHNFLYFFDATTSTFLSGFNVYSAESGINRTVSGTFFNVSSNNLTAGSNTFVLSLTGYTQNSTVISVNRTVPFNVTVNTTQTLIIIQAIDEISLQQLGFTLNLFLKGTNTTLINAVAYRAGKSCFYDTDESTSCFAVTATEGGSGMEKSVNTSSIQGFGNNIATFKIIWDVVNSSTGTGDSGTVRVLLQNGTVLFTETQAAPAVPTTFTSFFTMDNRFGYYTGIDNLTINVSATVTGSISDTTVTTIRELRIVNNSAGYIYASNTNNTISIPSLYTSGFTTVDAWFNGAGTSLMPDYVTPRMYRLSFSSLSDFQITAYLLNESLGYLQYLTVLDPNNAAVSDALVTIQNWYSGVATTVVQCASNPTGSCALFVRRYIEYQLIAQKTGYTTIQKAVVWTGLPNPANLYMSGNTNANYTSIFDGISLSISPLVENQNQSFNTTCSITASLGNLNFMNYTIYRQENNTLFQYNSTYSSSVPTGSAFKMPILNRGRYRTECTVQWVSNATGVATTYQAAYQQSYWNYLDPGQGIGSRAVDSIMGLGIYILAILVVALPLSRLSPVLGMLSGIGILAMGAFTEIFTWNTIQGNLGWYLAGLTILVVIAFFSLRNRF